jgi:hypothetical protein
MSKADQKIRLKVESDGEESKSSATFDLHKALREAMQFNEAASPVSSEGPVEIKLRCDRQGQSE